MPHSPVFFVTLAFAINFVTLSIVVVCSHVYITNLESAETRHRVLYPSGLGIQ